LTSFVRNLKILEDLNLDTKIKIFESLWVYQEVLENP
jgi:hypothetical protein